MTRQASCIMPWRAVGASELEILLVQRAPNLSTLGGFWAFAGGARDELDVQTAPDEPRLQSEHCGLRELFEETGILPPNLAAQARTQDERDDIRAALLEAHPQKSHQLAKLGLRAWLEHGGEQRLMPLGRWETPPFGSGRFVACYFALELPESAPFSEPQIWPGELVDARWTSPEQALFAHEHGNLFLAQPVRHTLEVLASKHGSAEARVAAAAEQLSQERPAERLALDFAEGITLVPLRTPTLAPHTHTNTYVLGHRRLAVVDPGATNPDEQERLVAYLQHRVARGAQVEAVWLTHAHHDHIGAAVRVKEAFGARIQAHGDAAARLPATIPVDDTIADGQILTLGSQSWHAIHTPGHAPGHLCFYAPETKHLLAGDHVLGFGTSLVSPRPDGDMSAYFASLKRVAELELGMLFPGHGPPSATAQKRIVDTLDQRQARERLILASVDECTARSEPVTIEALVARVYRGLGATLRGLAELSTRAHVEKLVDESKLVAIRATAPDGSVVFARHLARS